MSEDEYQGDQDNDNLEETIERLFLAIEFLMNKKKDNEHMPNIRKAIEHYIDVQYKDGWVLNEGDLCLARITNDELIPLKTELDLMAINIVRTWQRHKERLEQFREGYSLKKGKDPFDPKVVREYFIKTVDPKKLIRFKEINHMNMHYQPFSDYDYIQIKN